MESTSGRSLSKDTIDTCLGILRRIQDNGSAKPRERTAIHQLAEWLAQSDLSDSSDTDDALDESSRALLASFTDKWNRKRLTIGFAEGVGSSPSQRSSFFVKQPRIEGKEALAAELDKLSDWCDFDVFKVAALTNGQPLEAVTLAALERLELMDTLLLDKEKLVSFLREVEAAYVNNPYHNSTHAADVTQSLACILTSDDINSQLNNMELLCMIIAAAVHDVGHPGLANDFLVNADAETAVKYNDISVNENMHAARAFEILLKPQNNFLVHLSDSHYRFFRRTVISIVLATDMATHQELLSDFTSSVGVYGTDISRWRPDRRIRAMEMVVHCSDIANPAKPLRFSKQWSDRILREFFSQGDLEKERGLPVSPQCDREKVEIAKSQLIFLERVVRPCYRALKLLAPNGASVALGQIAEACKHWDSLQHNGHSELQASCRKDSGLTSDGQATVFPLEDVE